jgi:hypothetical protein
LPPLRHAFSCRPAEPTEATEGAEAESRNHDSVTGITECMTELPDYACQGNLGRPPMKTLLVGIAFAIGMVFASQAFALPYCPNSTWQHGHYVCASYDE